MKTYTDVLELNKEINSYVDHFSGLPLLVGIDNSSDYHSLLEMLIVDPSKQVIRMSDTCENEFPPNPSFRVSFVSNKAKEIPVIWLGAASSIMLYGQQETEQFFIDYAGSSIKGPVVLLCPFCCGVLEAIGNNYVKLGHNIVILRNDTRDIPSICVHGNNEPTSQSNPVIGIKGLLHCLEDGANETTIHVITSCEKKYLVASVYPYVESVSAYKTLCENEPGIAARTTEENGTNEQWQWLAKQVLESGSFAGVCENNLGPIKLLASDFSDYLEDNSEKRFLCFVALKVFFSTNNDYLGVCLKKCISADDLVPSIYNTILEVDPDNAKLSVMLRQRRRILQSFDENGTLMKDYCDRATIFGRNVLRYLSDNTEEERAALIHALCIYDYSTNELNTLLKDTSPELMLYLQKFTFDTYNTRVMESDSDVRDLLTDYFQRYKLQKISNRQDHEFVHMVEEEAHKRSFTKLPARSAIVKKLDKKDVQPYFFDALGVEFLAYIEAKAEEYGMLFECQVGHCNLPSITCKNKEFYDVFPEGSILKEDGIDEIKHRGIKYDYRVTMEPLHIFEELSIIDRDLKKMSTMLAAEKVKKIIILSDHGASRLAVTYESENDKLELEESGQHSGRCCPATSDPHIPFATYEDGFAVLANYERFKGSRKADVETHGGASLEEVVIPVIILTAKPKDQQVFFTETSIKCSAKDGSTIFLFANPPLHDPRMTINDMSYKGSFEGDKHNVKFEMSDLRRKGHYDADIYDGSKKIATLSFETKRSTITNDLL